jgi:hypothetical protein
VWRSATTTATVNALTCEITARQVGHKPAPVSSLIGGTLIDAERRAHDPINLEPAIGGADPEGCRPPARRCQYRCDLLVLPALVSCQDALYDPLTPDFVAPVRMSSTLLCDRAELGSARQRR